MQASYPADEGFGPDLAELVGRQSANHALLRELHGPLPYLGPLLPASRPFDEHVDEMMWPQSGIGAAVAAQTSLGEAAAIAASAAAAAAHVHSALAAATARLTRATAVDQVPGHPLLALLAGMLAPGVGLDDVLYQPASGWSQAPLMCSEVESVQCVCKRAAALAAAPKRLCARTRNDATYLWRPRTRASTQTGPRPRPNADALEGGAQRRSRQGGEENAGEERGRQRGRDARR
jgi:hypothetical protein